MLSQKCLMHKIISDVPVLYVFSPMKFIFYRFALNLLYKSIDIRSYLPINASGWPSLIAKIRVQLPFHQFVLRTSPPSFFWVFRTKPPVRAHIWSIKSVTSVKYIVPVEAHKKPFYFLFCLPPRFFI